MLIGRYLPLLQLKMISLDKKGSSRIQNPFIDTFKSTNSFYFRYFSLINGNSIDVVCLVLTLLISYIFTNWKFSLIIKLHIIRFSTTSYESERVKTPIFQPLTQVLIPS